MRPQPALRAAALILLCACCGDDDGGPCGNLLDAGTSGVTITVATQTFTFGDFRASMANDCGPESVSVEGEQVDPAPASTFRISFCLPNRGDVGQGAIPLGETMNFFAAAQSPGDGCVFTYDQAQEPAATVTMPGFCAAGDAPFSLSMSGTAPGTSSCGGAVTMTFAGAASVTGF